MSANSTTLLQCVQLKVPTGRSILTLFSHLQQTAGSMLLDSSDSHHVDAKYHIAVAQPLVFITAKQHEMTITKSTGEIDNVEAQPFDVLQQVQDQHPMSYIRSDNQALPFACGLLGMFGYDLGRTLETLPDNNNDEYQTPDMAVGLYAWSIVEDKETGDLFYQWHPDYPHPTLETVNKWLQCESLTAAESDFTMTSQWQSNMDKLGYHERLSTIKNYLYAGDCYQVNLAQRFSSQYSGSEWQAYQILRKANNAPFSAFIRLQSSVILSISPERFMSVNDRKVQTKPIKGTMPRSHNTEQDIRNAHTLKHSEKDRAENLMIVDLLRNDLSRTCQAGSIAVPKLFDIESFPAVHHLVSTVEGELRLEEDALSLIKRAFPGGSITGAPKIRAMEIIDELEPHRRNIYCGSIGYQDANGNMDTNICIRTLLCERQHLFCWAGGGIVLDSEANNEYQESLDKVAKILPILEQRYE